MNIEKSRIIETSKIIITLDKENVPNNYRILDIGGGGEGIISTLYKDKVVAIDIRKDELEEVKEKKFVKAYNGCN